VRVLLSGFDGDVVVSYGYEYLDELARTGKWADFAREAYALAQRRPQTNATRYLHHHGMPYLTELARKWRWWMFVKQVGEITAHFALSDLFLHACLKPFASQPLRWVCQWFHGLTQSTVPAGGLNNAINPIFAQRMNLAQRLQAFQAQESTLTSSFREQHMLALTDGGLEYVANVFDQTAATFALEPRYPFFDRRLIELCLALPFEHKLWHGWTRAILRRAMENILPPAVQWRLSKGNLSVNVRRKLLEERETLEAVILHDPRLIAAYIDIPALRAAYRRYLSRPATASEEDLFTVFLSVNLALWLRHSGLAPLNA
jgi:asparagine synthase (glutamine-hydrolysing)